MSIITCPKCNCQLEVRLSFASGPKSSTPSGDLGELIAAANDRADKLNAWEADFMKQLNERYEQYGERTKLSDKQMAALQKIAAGG